MLRLGCVECDDVAPTFVSNNGWTCATVYANNPSWDMANKCGTWKPDGYCKYECNVVHGRAISNDETCCVATTAAPTTAAPTTVAPTTAAATTAQPGPQIVRRNVASLNVSFSAALAA